MSKLAITLLVLGIVLSVGIGYGSYRLYDYVENDPAFCGSCHLMQQAWKTWQMGSHKHLTCHTCHQQDIIDRARIVWHWATRQYTSVPPHTRLPQRVCETCHMRQGSPSIQTLDTVGHTIHVGRVGLTCLACHAPSLHAVQPRVKDCQQCHTAAHMNLGGMVALHCTVCHNFLARDKEEEAIIPQRQACLACHTTMQIKAETFPAGAPMAFACANCHKPHVQPAVRFQDCLGCHASVLEDRAHFEHRALTDCVRCHLPHNWKATEWR